MKHLFVWGRGDFSEFNACARLCAQKIRELGDCEIIFATTNRIKAEGLDWADRVLTAPGVKVKSTHESTGVWKHLHEAGWTDPNVRSFVYETWASLFRSEKPDVVYSWGAYGVVLTSIFEEIRVIQMGSGVDILEPFDTDDESNFPELQAWIYHLTDIHPKTLLHQPSLIFCDPRVDRKRTNLHLHINPAVEHQNKTFDVSDILMIGNKSKESKELQTRMKALFSDKVIIISKQDWFKWASAVVNADQNHSPLLITHFDPVIFSQILYHGMKHIGLPVSSHEKMIADHARRSGIGHVFENGMENLEESIAYMQMDYDVDKTEPVYCPLENALKWITGKI